MALVTDRDSVIAVAGATRRELMEKQISAELENLMEGRQVYQWKDGDLKLAVTEEGGKYHISIAAPILSEGDVMGCVAFAAQDGEAPLGETEYKLAQTIAGFLGRHMEA